MILLLGFGGYANSGKDTAKDAAIEAAENLGYRATSLSFAKALRKVVLRINPFVPESARYYCDLVEAFGYEEAKKQPGVRDILVKYGAGMRDVFGENFWVDVVKKSIQTLQSEYHCIFISDVRYPNEADMIRGMGGKTVVINRKDNEAANSHERDTVSRTEFDIAIANNGSLEQFQDCVSRIVRDLLSK